MLNRLNRHGEATKDNALAFVANLYTKSFKDTLKTGFDFGENQNPLFLYHT